ncbi:MAG: CHASE4 domain-containing protein [Pseudomonadales bacterium]
MSIKRRMIMILTGLAVLYMIATYGVFRFAVFPTFEDLERDLAAENAERIIQILDFERELLRSVNQDWSSWDATHDFMTGNNDTYPASNLTTDALTTLELNALLLYRNDGVLEWGEVVDLSSGQPVPLEEIFLRRNKRFQKGFFAGDQKAAFTSLHIDYQGHQFLTAGDHILRMLDPLGILLHGSNAEIDHHGDCSHQNHRNTEAKKDLLSSLQRPKSLLTRFPDPFKHSERAPLNNVAKRTHRMGTHIGFRREIFTR